MSWKGVITNGGSALLDRWVAAGGSLDLHRAAAGTGRVEEMVLMAQTALKDERQEMQLVTRTKEETGTKLKLRVTAPEKGYPLTQYGVWAKLDGGVSTLLAIFQNDGQIDVPAKADNPDFSYTAYALLAISNQGELSVTIAPSTTVSQEDMEAALKTKADLGEDGKVKPEQMPELDFDPAGSAADAVNEHNKDKAAHPDIRAKTGETDPDEHTVGAVGQTYLNTATGDAFICTGADGGTYIWKRTGGMRPQIVVTAPSGSSVTVSCGKKRLTGTADRDNTCVFDLPGYGTWTVKATLGGENDEATVMVDQVKQYVVTLSYTRIYGVEWEGTQATTWNRTDDAELFENPTPAVNNGDGSSPFDNCMPWSGMEVVERPSGGTMVKIPKFWYKWTRSGVKMKLQIADKKTDGFSVSPAHADRGDGKGERNEVYIARYHCASDYKSTTGVQPKVSETRDQFRKGIQGLGTGYYMADFAMFWTVRMLYLVEYADWNGQKVIGYGCSPSSTIFNMGMTDNMTYHTGTTAKDRTTYGATQYRHIEGLWDNVYDWADGIRFSGQDIYVITKPSEFSDMANGTKVGTRPASSNYISAWIVPMGEGLDWALYPSEVGGTENNYVGDYCYYASAGVVLVVGGNYSQDQDHGPFCLDGNVAAAYQGSSIGSRSMELP